MKKIHDNVKNKSFAIALSGHYTENEIELRAFMRTVPGNNVTDAIFAYRLSTVTRPRVKLALR